MAAQQVGNAGACEKFGFGEINFGTKYMSDLMQTKAEWAKAILDADRLPVTHATILNPANANQNTYGALVLGLNVQQRGWTSADASVKKTLQSWITNLNTIFTAHQKYEPQQLLQFATDLNAAAECIARQSATLAQRAEITTPDHTYLSQVVQGLQSLAANLGKLHEAVKQGPDICEVNLDFPIRRH